MLVSNLQQFLVLLLPPLRAAGINASAEKSLTSSLETLAAALDPFKQLSLEQLSELLKVTQEYRQTGQPPEWMLGKKPLAPQGQEGSSKASEDDPSRCRGQAAGPTASGAQPGAR